MSYWGDLADEAADGLLEEQTKSLLEDKEEAESEGRRVEGLESKSLFTRLEFKWKASDRMILDRIRAACEAVTASEYASLSRALDELYCSVRLPVMGENGPKLDQNNRMIFQKDERGRYIEDWSTLNGQDLEVAIFHLQKSRVEMSTRTNELLQEAIFAKHIYNDEYQDGYKSLMEGTQGDRNAHANRVTREEKYFAFYKFCVWQSASTLLKEITNLQRVMERIRQWRISTYREREQL